LPVPSDYSAILLDYTRHGYRVIACATKALNSTDLDIGNIRREDAESDLEFVGFIIFENKLKPGTSTTIKQLSRAAIRTVMCTGDNILTAISVAKESCLIDKSADVYSPVFLEGSWSAIDLNIR
jgi:cation-transporting ATPase 13A2